MTGHKAFEIIDDIMFTSNDPHIAETWVGDVHISTIELPSIYGSLGKKFETMIFGGEHDGYTQRYHNKKQAIQGHLFAVGLVNARRNDDSSNSEDM